MFKKILEVGKKNDVASTGAEVLSGIFLDGALGQIAPGITALRASYKQRQHEERTEIIFSAIFQEIDYLFEQFNNLKADQQEFVDNIAFPLMLENAIEETEKAKIEYIFNAFKNIVTKGITEEDLIIGYYDVLKGLRLNEINRLIQLTPEYRKEHFSSGKTITLNVDLSEKGKERREFTNYMDSKLEQYGLLHGDIIVNGPGHTQPFDNSPITPFAVNFLNFIKQSTKTTRSV
ncbi:hypothetical protein [Priestia megaterium]|uniref:hypothetical protein n=1 Tax=Priestia megaterium TaxID=1404 RepID=UPI003670B5D9